MTKRGAELQHLDTPRQVANEAARLLATGRDPLDRHATYVFLEKEGDGFSSPRRRGESSLQMMKGAHDCATMSSQHGTREPLTEGEGG